LVAFEVTPTTASSSVARTSAPDSRQAVDPTLRPSALRDFIVISGHRQALSQRASRAPHSDRLPGGWQPAETVRNDDRSVRAADDPAGDAAPQLVPARADNHELCAAIPRELSDPPPR
jgi:hypothetical protein